MKQVEEQEADENDESNSVNSPSGSDDEYSDKGVVKRVRDHRYKLL